MKDTAQLQIFKDFDGYSPKYHFFKNSLFGQIHDSLPWEELASLLPRENTGPGAPKWFDARGMFALMFLKAYLNVSDRHLIERFNTDYSLQMFCGKLLAEDRQIRDTTIMTRVRKDIEEHCEWERIQSVLLDCWKRDVNNSHVLLMPACRQAGTPPATKAISVSPPMSSCWAMKSDNHTLHGFKLLNFPRSPEYRCL